MDEESLDLTGLKCPLPALMTRKALAAMTPGTLLVVTASDPLSIVDIPHMCGEEGHEVENISRAEGRAIFRIRRKG